MPTKILHYQSTANSQLVDLARRRFKLKIDQKLKPNILNHFSDGGKHVLAVKNKLTFLTSIFGQ